jgi:hypothetical protein
MKSNSIILVDLAMEAVQPIGKNRIDSLHRLVLVKQCEGIAIFGMSGSSQRMPVERRDILRNFVLNASHPLLQVILASA